MTKIKGNRNIFNVIGIILLFILISGIYFYPQLEGKKLVASDQITSQGASKEISDFRNATGKEALWTDSMFGGMPAYMISTQFPGNLLSKIQVSFFSIFHRPIGLMVLNLLFFFILCQLMDIPLGISMAGSVMFGFSTFFFVFIATGHVTKVHTLTYMALVVAGVIYAYKKKPIAGSIITAFGLSWMILANHPQMYYYVGMMIIIIIICYFIGAVREKTLKKFLSTSGLLFIALLLAIGTNFGRLTTTMEYGKYSTRGKSELKTGNDQTSGLDKAYILDYSYDLGEAMTAFIPHFKGGGMDESLGESSSVYKIIKKSQGESLAKRICAHLPLYWGSQPISVAPFYFGSILCFLFVLGLFIIKGREKWWIVSVVVVSFLLSLGKYFPLLSNFMIDYFPGYNKFRDVKNIIVIQQFAMAFMGILAISKIYRNPSKNAEFIKKLSYAWYITAGLALIFVLFPTIAGNFRGAGDAQLTSAGWPNQLINALIDDRKMVLRNDSIKAFIFITLAAGVIWLYLKKKLKAGYALVLWAGLILFDMWPVDRKYLNVENFATESSASNSYKASAADLAILKDKSPDYRVLNLTVNPFSDASTSYFHKSIGGYNGAKMKRYQELIDYHISPEINKIIKGFNNQESLDSTLSMLPILNMLNTKYIIYSTKENPIVNRNAAGNAWFVNNIKTVNDAQSEINALGDFDPKVQAIVDKRFAKETENISISKNGSSSITLKKYLPNMMEYDASVKGENGLAVFSEIWYPKGWNAYIDGKKADYFRADYVLRAMVIPSGNHRIVFKFEPSSYFIGNNISRASSIILLLLTFIIIYVEWKKRKGQRMSKQPDN